MGSLRLFRNAPEVIPVPAGGYIFRKGEAAKVMFLIIEGEVDLVLGGKVIETAGEGTFIGEMALIDEEPRSASARVRSDCRVFPIDEERFQSLVRETPFFALQMMKILARRLRTMDALIAAKLRLKPKPKVKVKKKKPASRGPSRSGKRGR